MSVITVLGAGFMGAAVTFPLAAVGHEVRLWGTWLDDPLLEACRRGPHPRLRLPLPSAVRLFAAGELEPALAGTDALFFGISSEGFVPVLERLLPCPAFRPDLPIFSLTKGFIPWRGAALRASECAEAMHAERFPGRPLRWASIGGPVKAVELAQGVPTASVYALADRSLESFLPSFRTPFYRVHAGSDLVGLELCAILKNAYAILLAKALEEMARIIEAAGGQARTAFDLPGAGDLYVTAQSGRNRRYGERVGRGEDPATAYERMCAGGEIAEGYPAVRLGSQYLKSRYPGWEERLPVFSTLHRVLAGGSPCGAELDSLVLRYP
jgi:glycerol-3-phosphate dehydrogenase (NAD(P)+)